MAERPNPLLRPGRADFVNNLLDSRENTGREKGAYATLTCEILDLCTDGELVNRTQTIYEEAIRNARIRSNPFSSQRPLSIPSSQGILSNPNYSPISGLKRLPRLRKLETILKDENQMELLKKVIDETIQTMLSGLERDFIIARFGIGGGEPHTLEEVGILLGIRQRERNYPYRIEQHALSKLRKRGDKIASLLDS